MGLWKAGTEAAKGVLADQWREYFYCDSLENEVLVAKGQKRTGRNSSNKKGNENIISNGSVIAVNEGQSMVIVEQGKVVEFCTEPGEYVYETGGEDSLFYGNTEEKAENVLEMLGKRFGFGGDAANDQRIYYFNRKEIVGNKYGTPAPVPFRVVDQNIGLDMDIAIRCHGEFSYRIEDPVLFYTNVCGNVTEVFRRDELESQLRSELLTALQPAFARISETGVRYSALMGHTLEIAAVLKEVLSVKWRDIRGIEIVSFGINGLKASEEDEAMLKEMQRTALLRNPTMAAAALVGAQTDAMRAAAHNQGGAMMGFAGMNMAAQAGGMDAGQLFQMGQQTAAQSQGGIGGGNGAQAPGKTEKDSWDCGCGAKGNTGRFCTQCGSRRPEKGWICGVCKTENTGNFCMECGAKKPD